MYLATIILLMGVFPLISIAAEAVLHPAPDIALLAGKWFVFWAVGVRLFVAGLRQVLNPSFTASTIFNIRDPQALKVVQELGFGNLSIGLLGLLSLILPAWLLPASVTGGLFLLLAGIKHVLNGGRTVKENIAMASDLLIALILAAFIVTQAFGS